MSYEDPRTVRTRAALSNSLVELVLQRGYAAVKVEHVAAHAAVGRATFYTHFATKEALYDYTVESILGELRLLLEDVDREHAGFTGQPVRALFGHASKNPNAYRMILRGEGDGRGLRLLIERWAAVAEQIFADRVHAQDVRPRVDLRVIAQAWAGEQVAVLLWWLDAPAPRPGLDQVVQTLADLSRYGRHWASGFSVTP